MFDLVDLNKWMMLQHRDHRIIYIIGLLVISSFIVHNVTKKLKIPSVVGYVLIGVLFSASILEKIPFLSANFIAWYSYLINSFSYFTILAVSFISFTIGTSLSIKVLQRLELEFTMIVLLESIGAFILVTLSVLALGKPLYLALILGAIATATAPAATVLVLKEYGTKGELSATLMVVLALDETMALIIFSFVKPIARFIILKVPDLTLTGLFLIPLGKILGAIVIGLIIGYLSQLVMSNYFVKYDKILLILATVFGVSALTIFLDFSPLIANLTVGFAYRNFPRKNLNIAEDIETLTIPIYAIFFILAGTRIDIIHISSINFIILALTYTVARLIGKVGGATLGANISKSSTKVRKYIGTGLLPQIGVAIDLAYIIQREFIHLPGEASDIYILIFNIILLTSLFTEIVGPLATEYALSKAGEIRRY